MAKRSKSVLKRIRQNEKRRLRNRHYKTMVKNIIKKVRAAVEAKDVEQAKALLPQAVSIINKAVSKGVIHWRNASRKVSRLSRMVNSLEKEASPS